MKKILICIAKIILVIIVLFTNNHKDIYKMKTSSK